MKIIFTVLFFLVATGICYSQVNVYDGFETPELSKVWAKDRMVDSSLQMQSAIVRNGHSAARITIHTGDTFEKGEGKSKDSERDELREADLLVSREAKSYEYQFSLFLPGDFPIVPTRLVIAQWKQDCPGNAVCSDNSPVLAIRYVAGKLYITIQSDTIKRTLYQTKEEVRNKWLDFKFNICFSRTDSGHVDAWLNEKPIISYKGITAYSERSGYFNKSYFYFKMGLYRDIMPQPMIIYIDEYRKKELTE
jgi:hypothetical protein